MAVAALWVIMILVLPLSFSFSALRRFGFGKIVKGGKGIVSIPAHPL